MGAVVTQKCAEDDVLDGGEPFRALLGRQPRLPIAYEGHPGAEIAGDTDCDVFKRGFASLCGTDRSGQSPDIGSRGFTGLGVDRES